MGPLALRSASACEKYLQESLATVRAQIADAGFFGPMRVKWDRWHSVRHRHAKNIYKSRSPPCEPKLLMQGFSAQRASNGTIGTPFGIGMRKIFTRVARHRASPNC